MRGYYLAAIIAVILITAGMIYVNKRALHEQFAIGSPFHDKVVVITGSTRGIGFAIAAHSIKNGASAVIINGRLQEDVDKAVRMLSNEANFSGTIDSYAADISILKECKELISYVATTRGRIDILINNAAVVGKNTEDWENELNTNVSGPLYLTRAALLAGPVKVINIGSGAADIDGQTAIENDIPGSYVVSKAALNKLTSILGAEATTESTVTCLQINGTVATDLTTNREPTISIPQVTRALDKLLLKSRVETNGKVIQLSDLLDIPGRAEAEALAISSTRAVAIDMVSGVQQFIDSVIDKNENENESINGLILLSGTNPLGSSDSVSADMSGYPSKDKEGQLINKLADVTHAKSAEICLFPGTLAAIEAVASTFCKPGASIIYGIPGWTPFVNHMSLRGYNMIGVSYNDNNILTQFTNKVQNVGPCMVYLSSPQYPTGTSLDKSAFITFMKTIPVNVAVVIDQCYLEYANENAFDGASYVNKYPNLVITRSLSKFYGLASLRLAYTISNPLVTYALAQQVTNPFLSTYMVDAALSTLGDNEYHAKVYKYNAKERARILKELKIHGADRNQSDSNFVLAKVPEKTTLLTIASRLKIAGYLTQQDRLYFNDKYYLITIQSKEANDAQLSAIYKQK